MSYSPSLRLPPFKTSNLRCSLCRNGPIHQPSADQHTRTVLTRCSGDLQRPVITYKPHVKSAGPSPTPAPVVHSPTYLLDTSPCFSSEDEAPSTSEPESTKSRSYNNAFEWALHQADQKLNQIESNPDSNTNVALNVVKGPVGQATLSTMQGVATVTAAAGPEVMKVAMPLGKQLFKMSAKVLVAGASAVGTAAAESRAKTKATASKKQEEEAKPQSNDKQNM